MELLAYKLDRRSAVAGALLATLCLALLALLVALCAGGPAVAPQPAGCLAVSSSDQLRFRAQSVAGGDLRTLARLAGYLELAPGVLPGLNRFMPLEVDSIMLVSSTTNTGTITSLVLRTMCAQIELQLNGNSSSRPMIVSAIQIQLDRSQTMLADLNCVVQQPAIRVPYAQHHYRCLRTSQFLCFEAQHNTLSLTLTSYLLEFEVDSDPAKANQAEYTFAADDCR